MMRTCLLLAALVAWPLAAAEQQSPADTVGTDPARAWGLFLDKAEFEQVYPAYDVLDKVGYRPDGVDAVLCREHAGALQAAVAAAPVSIVLRRAAMLCAEAVGDDADAERALTALAALAKLALSQASNNVNPKPIRVLRPDDAYALLHASGLEYRYDYYAEVAVKRYFPLVIAAWDPEAKLEYHLTFDYIDTIQRIDRKDRFSGFPFNRNQYVDAFVESQVKGNDILGLDIQAVRDAIGVTATKDKVAKLRATAERGGIQSALNWLTLCASKPFPGCGDGFVDAVLPQAEKQHALPMTLLAYAYAEGVGVEPDAESARQLLAAADKRWRYDGATLTYAALWAINHKGALPDALRQRLVQAQARGNANARLLLMREKFVANPAAAFDDAEVAFLSEPKHNGLGSGYAMLAGYHARLKHKQETLEWAKRAAEAGNAEAQSSYGLALLDGDGIAADRVAGERMLAEAAHGGDTWSQRYLASLSAQQGRWADAEGWLMAAVDSGDIKAVLFLAELYEWERPGVSGKVDRAVEIYRALADADNVAEGRRRLAVMALAGRGMKKDPGQAKQWLLADAERGDHASEYMLGMSYLQGELGNVDEAEGTRWIERAIKAKQEQAYADYGYWLFYKKQTPQSRSRALELWRAGETLGAPGSSNNLAWVLCTSDDAAVFDAKAGLASAGKMGEVGKLGATALDTVAACHAAAGDYKRAAELQARAIELLKKARNVAATANSDEDDTRRYRDRLALYDKQQRYIEPVVRK